MKKTPVTYASHLPTRDLVFQMLNWKNFLNLSSPVLRAARGWASLSFTRLWTGTTAGFESLPPQGRDRDSLSSCREMRVLQIAEVSSMKTKIANDSWASFSAGPATTAVRLNTVRFFHS